MRLKNKNYKPPSTLSKATDNCRRLYYFILKRENIFEVNISDCRNPFGFPFIKSKHPIVDFLFQYERNPDLTIKESIIYNYHLSFLPKFSSELLQKRTVEFSPPFLFLPWGKGFDLPVENFEIKEMDWSSSRWCGPSSNKLIKYVFESTINLYDGIKNYGYRPWTKNGLIGVTALESVNNECKYVVLDGNHRISCLAKLGYNTVLATYVEKKHKRIFENDIDNWFFVKKEKCNKNDALKYFYHFFISGSYIKI